MRQQVGEDGGLKKITVHTDQLKTEVQKNRDQHVEDYNQALVGWRKEIIPALMKDIVELNQQIIKVQDRVKRISAEEENGTYHPKVDSLVSHIKDYDRTLKMLAMSADTTIEIEEFAFNQLVMDEWEWSDVFKSSVSNYTVASARR